MPHVPAYERIAADLRAQIASGEIAVGAPLPSMSKLRAKYGVSDTAVRNALLMLRAEGITEGRPGVGVFVLRLP